MKYIKQTFFENWKSDFKLKDYFSHEGYELICRISQLQLSKSQSCVVGRAHLGFLFFTYTFSLMWIWEGLKRLHTSIFIIIISYYIICAIFIAIVISLIESNKPYSDKVTLDQLIFIILGNLKAKSYVFTNPSLRTPVTRTTDTHTRTHRHTHTHRHTERWT